MRLVTRRVLLSKLSYKISDLSGDDREISFYYSDWF